MEKILKTIVDTKGRQIFKDPRQLMQDLEMNGSPVQENLIVGLILQSCPSVGNILSNEQVSRAEAQMMISAAVAATGLTASTVRKYISIFIRACNITENWVPRLMTNDPKPTITLTPMEIDEDDTVEAILRRIAEDEECTAELHDLDVLSRNGNIYASYAMGMFYREVDERFGTEHGKPFFKRAADQGYGPAMGALASYQIRAKSKNLGKAAACFENPTAIFGNDGRQWSMLSEQLLEYREQNEKRINTCFWLMLASILFTAIGAFALSQFAIFWTIFALLCLIGGFAWIAFIKFFKPYGSCRLSCYLMAVSWIFLLIAYIV